MIKHFLKCWPEYFYRLCAGTKTFEVRQNDRDFQVGDILILREWNPDTGNDTGEFIEFTVTYILHGGQFGIEPGYVVMGLKESNTHLNQELQIPQEKGPSNV